MLVVSLQVFRAKKWQKRKHVFVNNNVRFYYPQTFLEECKYGQEKIKMENLIDDDLEKSSSDESDSESDNEKIMMNLRNNLLKAKKVF